MPDFTANWNIDVFDAETPADAARQAWMRMRKPDSTANVFDITDDQGNITRVDLQELDEEADLEDAPTATDDNEPTEYRVRIAVTVRAYAEDNFVAGSWDEAVEKAKAINPHEYRFRYDHDDIEGDPLVYLGEADEDPEHEVDIRTEGEPFSWTAANLVKDLAKADTTLSPAEMLTAMKGFIERARNACAKDD